MFLVILNIVVYSTCKSLDFNIRLLLLGSSAIQSHAPILITKQHIYKPTSFTLIASFTSPTEPISSHLTTHTLAMSLL